METAIRCVLTFDTNLDTKRTMSLSDPRQDLEAEGVKNAAISIISANLHDESIGAFTSLHRADLVSTSTNVLI